MNKKKSIIVAAALVCVFAVVLTFVIFRAVHSHEEGGLLEVCWENGMASYVDGEPQCESPEKLVWSQGQVPLLTFVVDGDGKDIPNGDSYRQAVSSAIVDINIQLGFNMFELTSHRTGSSVMLQVGTPIQIPGATPSILGGTVHAEVMGRMVCYSSIRSNVDSLRLRYLVIHHELLHCAGLEHDEQEYSAMHPITEDDTLHPTMRRARITDHDKELLQDLYKDGGVEWSLE